MDSIKEILSHGTLTAKELEMMIGRLGHLGAIIPFVYHFLSILRDLQWNNNPSPSHSLAGMTFS
jgi:hypothetical protein